MRIECNATQTLVKLPTNADYESESQNVFVRVPTCYTIQYRSICQNVLTIIRALSAIKTVGKLGNRAE